MILSISGKVSDLFSCSIGDDEHDGYVPYDLGIGGGDYIKMDIDTETGKIVGWEPFTISEFRQAIKYA